jgi:uncharacterized membrane protein YphA (DoxX/SURF4 family)
LITIQVGLLYFGSGFWKLVNPWWHTGEMLRWSFMGPWGTPVSFWLVNLNLPPFLWTALTWSVIVFELGMPIGLFVPRLRRFAILAGTVFHLGNLVLLNIPEFLNCVAAYVLFVPPEAVKGGAGVLRWYALRVGRIVGLGPHARARS